MTHPIWPLFDIRVVTPRLELRAIDDELGTELALLAAKGVHDPSWMPFGIPWTDVASPELERNCMQFYWRCRADFSPTSWNLNFAVFEDGVLVGSTGMMAHDFPVLRQFETGSWLGREFQGKGIGKEMRQATLHLGFAGFGAQSAATGAWTDNGPSLGVTRSLGYEENGWRPMVRRGDGGKILLFEMSRDHWEANLQRDDIHVDGADPCRSLLGLDQ